MKSTFQPWEKASENVVESIRSMVTDSLFWKELTKYYAEESDTETDEVVTQDNASCVKSICALCDYVNI